MEKELSIILLNWNTKDLMKDCLRSLFETTKGDYYDVIVVDNGSSDGSLEMLRQHFPNLKVITHGKNHGFSKGYNLVLKDVKNPYVLLLNTDTIILDGVVEGMLNFLKTNPDVGIVAPQYLNADGTKQTTFSNFPTLSTELLNRSLLQFLFPWWYPSKRQDYNKPLEVEAVKAAGPMLRQEAFRQVGFFDEDYFIFLEETDLCCRLRKAGWRCVALPNLKMYHLGGGGTKKKIRAETTIEYYRSLYKFFRKNRSAPEYLLFRIFKPFKLVMNLLLCFVGLIFTLFQHEGLKTRFITYLKVLQWHLRGCPEGFGLKR